MTLRGRRQHSFQNLPPTPCPVEVCILWAARLPQRQPATRRLCTDSGSGHSAPYLSRTRCPSTLARVACCTMFISSSALWRTCISRCAGLVVCISCTASMVPRSSLLSPLRDAVHARSSSTSSCSRRSSSWYCSRPWWLGGGSGPYPGAACPQESHLPSSPSCGGNCLWSSRAASWSSALPSTSGSCLLPSTLVLALLRKLLYCPRIQVGLVPHDFRPGVDQWSAARRGGQA